MVREVIELFLPLDEDEASLPRLAARAAGLSPDRVGSIEVLKRSLDARKGHPIGYKLRVAISPPGAPPPARPEGLPPPPRLGRPLSVVVVGSGPAGTFAALRLSQAGARVAVVERGKPVQPRRRDLASLAARGGLDPDSNYCFGEGGAGTFSDGKLYTRSKDRPAVAEVLRTLVAHGADPSIEVDSRPHIGSNRLPKILLALRAHLESLGVTYTWSDPVEDLALAEGGRIAGVRLRSGAELSADAVVLAVGHSARPVYQLLHRRGVALVAKPFAVGARVEHAQPYIDKLQYGRASGHPKLPAAFYQLTATVPSGAGERGVYSFCMCPGGWIVPSATEPGGLCVNGMSLKRRDSPFADSALVVTVDPRDFPGDSPLAGVDLQRAIEERAFAAGGGGFVAPAQRCADFVAGRASSRLEGSSYRPAIAPGRLDQLLPPWVAEALARALARFDRTLPSFTAAGQLVGVETRTSSPVRIVRGEKTLESPSHRGLFPSGEGAGYAGGIVSAAIDGLRIADAILST
jgi:uncharacterized protein